MNWSSRAACSGMPTSMFYSEEGSRRNGQPPPDEKRAKRLCARCPVRLECLAYALTIESKPLVIGTGTKAGHQADISIKPRAWGIWGGHNARERTVTNIRHLDGCTSREHGACRPISEQVRLLDELFQARADETAGFTKPYVRRTA